ncbi:MAG: hypothetical protein AAF698_07250, partial [Pseudomonadota bacterium]
VAPGGRVVFATCSFLPIEGPERMDAFVARHPHWHLVAKPATLTTLPTAGGPDGFFAVPYSDNARRS